MADQAVQWIDAGGGVTSLRQGADTTVQEGTTGRWSPLPLFIVERVPLQPGQRFRTIVHGALRVSVPIALYGSSASALRTSLRTWARRLDSTRGDGTLRITGPAGDQRDLVCRCTGGLEQATEDDWSDLKNKISAVLTFTSQQPYWQDTSDTVQSWQLATSSATFFPFFPLALSDSTVFSAATVDNTASDVDVWPVWTIAGPGSNPILRNLTSGKFFSLPVTLQAGESVVVDTRPGVKTVTKQDGTNLFGSQASGSALWALLASQVNSLRIEYSSVTAGVSQVTLNFRRRYLSA